MAVLSATSLYAQAASALDRPVAARVNGTPIYAADVDRGLRSDTEADAKEIVRHEHLQRIVQAMLVEQAASVLQLRVDPAKVEREFQDLKKNPPSPCGCHAPSTLEAYLQTNAMSEEDLRLEIRRNQAMDLLLEREWKLRYPTQAEQDALVRANAQRLGKEYRKVWQIFTDAPEVVPETAKSTQKAKEAKARLDAALAELAAGNSFEEVARKYSEDWATAPQGGYLGYRPTNQDLLGLVDTKRWPLLKASVIHGPYRSWIGYHAVRIEPLADADVLAILKTEYNSEHSAQILQKINAQAKVDPADLLATP